MALTPNPSAEFEPTTPGDVAHQTDHDKINPMLQPVLDATSGSMFRRVAGGILEALATTAFGRSLLNQPTATALRDTANVDSRGEVTTKANAARDAAIATAKTYTDQEVEAAVKAGAVNPRGVWDAGIAYDTLDLVYHAGNSWYANEPTVPGDEPGVAATWTSYAAGLDEATANAAFRTTVNALGYGADPSGVADSTAAINAAVAATPAGGTTYLPRGVYRITDFIDLNRSGITLQGDGPRSTVIYPVWNAAAPMPDAIQVGGTEASPAEKVELCDFAIIGDAPYALVGDDGFIGVNWGRVSVKWTKGYTARNLYAERISWLTDARDCERITIENLEGWECFGVVSLIRDYNGTVSDLRGNRVETVLDFSQGANFACANIQGTASTVRNTDEGIDCGGMSNVSITGFSFDGFGDGIRVKREGPASDRWHKIAISDGVITNHKGYGIRASTAGAEPASKDTRLKVSDVTIDSDEPGSHGVFVGPWARKVDLDDMTVRVGNRLVEARGVDDLSLNGGVWESAGTDGPGAPVWVGKDPGGASGDRFRAQDIRLGAGSEMSLTRYLLDAVECHGIELHHVEVMESRGRGFRIRNCRHPRVTNCPLSNIHGTRTLEIEWTSASFVGGLKLGAVIDGNVIRDWGLTAANAPAIRVNVAIDGGDAYLIFSISGNRMWRTVAANSQIGLQILKGTIPSLDWGKVDDNLIEAPTPTSGLGNLGANTTQSNNTSKS